MSNSREISQLSSFITVDDATKNIGITSGITPFVGIGSTSPTVKLDVVGDANVSGNVTAQNYYGSGANLTGISTFANANIASGIFSNIYVSGISTLGITSATNLTAQQLNVSGISTLAGKIVSGNGIGNTNLSNTLNYSSSSGITAFRPISLVDSAAGIKISRNAGQTNGAAVELQTWDVGIVTNYSYWDINAENGYFGIRDRKNGFSRIFIDDSGSILLGANSATFSNNYAQLVGVGTDKLLNVLGNSYISGSVGIGTTNPTSKLHVIGDVRVTGVVTATTFVGALTGIAASATQLVTPRTFEITGDVVASPISFDGTGNVSFAATIQPNSVGLGTDTTGDYVRDITGTVNQISVSATSGEGSTPTLSIPSQFTAPQDVTVTRDLLVSRNLNVNGNITIGGTSATLFTTELKISDPDIVLGFRTDGSGNDVSNDNTANHGGVALASTEGTPLVDLFIAGIETAPATYKKIMWFKSGTFAGLGTDAWLINYAVGIGSTQFPTDTRLAAGNVQFTQNDLAVVRNINASGVVTATTFVGALTGTASSTTNIPNLTGAITSVNTITSLGSFSSSDLATALTDETGSGSAVFATSPTLVTPVLGAATATSIVVSSGSTFTNGPILVGAATSTGTALQPLQVTGGAYVSGNLGIGTTNPVSPLHMVGVGSTGGIRIGTLDFFPFSSGNPGSGSPTFRNSTPNSKTILRVIPNGTENSQFEFFGKDYYADNNAWDNFRIVTTGTSYRIDTSYGTTGSILPIILETGVNSGGISTNPNQLYLSTNGNIGIGTSIPTSKLHVSGDVRVSGVVTATTFIGSLTGTATTAGIATNLKGGVIGNIPYQSAADTTVFLTNGDSGKVLQSNGVGAAPTWVVAAPFGAVTGLVVRDFNNNIVGTSGSVSQLTFSTGLSVTGTTGAAGIATITLSSNIVGTSLSISGISTLGVTSATNLTSQQLNVSGISTFTNGPILVGTGTSTGTASQPLQVSGGAYVSGNLGIGTTNPTKPLHIYTADGDIKIGDITDGTGSTDAGIIFTGLGTVTSALFTEVNGEILSYGINCPQIIGIETARAGGIFRLDTRTSGSYGDANCFVVKGRPLGTTTEYNAIVVGLNDGNTYLSPDRGSVLVGTATSTGTASQRLQVTGGAYVSGNTGIGTTNPVYKLSVYGNSTKTSADGALFVLSSNDASNAFQLLIARSNSSVTKPYYSIESVEQGVAYRNLSLLPSGGNVTIGSTLDTGTPSQTLQVTGGAYVSGSVGIGTTNPTARLNLYDTAGSAAWRFRIGTNVSDGAGFYQRANGDFEMVLRDASNNNNYILGSSGNLSLRPTSNVLINTDTPTGTASQPLQVTGGAYVSGNLGIGTTNPTTKLDVAGIGQFTANGATLNLIGSDHSYVQWYPDGVASGRKAYTGFPNASVNYFEIANTISDGTGHIYLNPGTSAAVLINATTATGTTSQELQVNSGAYVSGNLGVGVTNPAYNIDVTGSVGITTTSGDILILSSTLSNGRTSIILNTNGNDWELGSRGSGASPINSFYIYDRNASAYRQVIDPSGNVLLGGTTAATGTASQRLQVTGGAYVSANLGVGVTNPASRIDVWSTTSGSTAIRATSSPSFSSTLYPGVISGLSTTGSGFPNFAASGIGVTSGEIGVYSFFPTFTNFPADRGPRRAVDLVGGFSTGIWGTEYFAINVGRNGASNDSSILNNERLRVDGSGKIGIGTTNPQGSIHIFRQDTVSGIETHTDFILENPGKGNARFFLKTRDNNRNWEFFADDDDGSFGIYDGVAPARRFTILPSGNVLIGSSSTIGTGTTDQRLQVSGGAYVSGNLGIGTASPAFKADIAGDVRVTSENKMRFGGTAGTTNFYIQHNSTTNSLDFVAG